ncbi:hypothetical protein BDZ89DRAFT_1136333 [Hymenopellis radicata]|nr:hypothetical protein BDZ89DRAFT_1136333 [Hymenopellis radicata]
MDASLNFAHCPAELLSENFLSAVGNAQVELDDTHTTTFPWNLSRVCRSWRTTSLGYSRLWATFVIDLSTAFAPDALAATLRRSRTYPLTFEFYMPRVSSDDRKAWAALRMLAAESHRWKSVIFSIPAPTLQSFLASDVISDLSTLELLSLESTSTSSEAPLQPPSFDTFLVAPNLKDVKLEVDMEFGLPWDRLQKFRYMYTQPRTLDYLLSIPRQSPNLEGFAVTFKDDMFGSAERVLPTQGCIHTYTNMHHLWVENDVFLHQLCLPNLESLRVTLHPQNQGLLASFLQRSRLHNLHGLFITGMQPGEFASIAENASTIENLALVMRGSGPVQPFHWLTLDKQLLPRLDHFAMFVVGASHRHADTEHESDVYTVAPSVCAFVRSRKMLTVHVSLLRDECDGCIRHVKWRDPTGDREVLRELRDGGLDLVLSSCGQDYLI